MYRIDTVTKHTDLFGPSRDGWDLVRPDVAIGPTLNDVPWMNATQEELSRALEFNGVALDKSNNQQLAGLLANFSVGNWERVDTGVTAWTPKAIAYDPTTSDARPFGLWVVCGLGGGQFATSLDGRTFTLAVVDANPANVYVAIAFSPGVGWIAVGWNDEGTYRVPLAATSADGVTWTTGLNADDIWGDSGLMAVARDTTHNVWVAAGESGLVVHSADGAAWSAHAGIGTGRFTSINFTGVAAKGGTVVLTGAYLTTGLSTFRSTDGGAHWTGNAGTGAAANGQSAISCDGSTFLRVGNGHAYSSPDGATWTDVSSGLPSSADLRFVAVYGGPWLSVWVAGGAPSTGTPGRFWTRTGTSAWQERHALHTPGHTDSILLSGCWGGGGFTLVYSSYATGKVAVSRRVL
jgi:hypothetical protein